MDNFGTPGEENRKWSKPKPQFTKLKCNFRELDQNLNGKLRPRVFGKTVKHKMISKPMQTPHGLSVGSTTQNSDGSTVTRFYQKYDDIDVYNGDITRRVSKTRTISVLDQCTGKKSDRVVKGTTTYVCHFNSFFTQNNK